MHRFAESNKERASLLLVCYSYPPVVGGSENEAQRVSAALRQRGHEVCVLCAGGAPMPPARDWVDPYGTQVRIFGGETTPRWRGRVFAAAVGRELIGRRKEYRIAYFLMTGLHVLAGVPISRLLGKRVLMKFSGSGEIRRLMKSTVGKIEILLLRRLAHRIMILNPDMAEEAAEAGFDRARLVWMPNPVDTEEFRPCDEGQRLELRNSLGLQATAPVVVYVGRFDPPKELPCLVKAFAAVTRRSPEAVLALVGDGPVRGELEALVRELGLDRNVRFAGMVDTGLVRSWLQASDVFALVSSLEGLPCALIEAMSVGLPAVVSDIPANTQLIANGEHGLVAQLRNEESIAISIVRLISDPALRARLGAAARRRVVEEYSTERVVEHYETLFREVLR